MRSNTYIVETLNSLNGEITVGGCKNTTLKALLAFPHIATGEMVLQNAATHTQAAFMTEFLNKCGSSCNSSGNRLVIKAETLTLPRDVINDSMGKLRHLYRIAVPMVTHSESITFPKPGYSPYGPRSIKPVIDALKRFEMDVSEDGGEITLHWNPEKRLSGALSILAPAEIACRAVSEALLAAAVGRKGITTILNIAQEPDLIDIANLYENFAPIKISGKGTNTWVVESEGIDILSPYNVDFNVPGDFLEASTISAAVAVIGGDVKINGFDPNRMLSIIDILISSGVEVDIGDDWIRVISNGQPKATSIETDRFPGFPTDAQGPFLTLMALATGHSIVRENIWTNRLTQSAELSKMGANIQLIDGQTASISGVNKLKGCHVVGTCPRSAAGLVIAGLKASGTTHVTGRDLINNAYTSLIPNLNKLGANITELPEEENISRFHKSFGKLEAF